MAWNKRKYFHHNILKIDMLCDFTFNHFEHGGWIQVSKTNLNNEMGHSRTMKKIVEPAHLYLNPTFQGQLMKNIDL